MMAKLGKKIDLSAIQSELPSIILAECDANSLCIEDLRKMLRLSQMIEMLPTIL